MFGIFKTKAKVEKLLNKYEKLMAECHKLSSHNREESHKKYSEAKAILNEIETLL